MNKSRLKGATAPIALCIALMAQPAFAQDEVGDAEVAAEDESAGDAGAPDSGVVAEEDEGTIFVTGSRIRRSEFNSPDPIAIVSPAIAQAQGQVSTAQMLQNSPIASGSAQVTSAISAVFNTDGGLGAETISLRGLGANRTLVLLNGRRAGPSGTRGSVSAFDLNALPLSVIESVEILKTGASSIYGSDAVAGVVNIITKKDIDGFEIDGMISQPFKSGGEEYRISGTWGKTFGNGHISATLDWNKKEMLRRNDREYLDCPQEYIFEGVDTGGFLENGDIDYDSNGRARTSSIRARDRRVATTSCGVTSGPMTMSSTRRASISTTTTARWRSLSGRTWLPIPAPEAPWCRLRASSVSVTRSLTRFPQARSA